MLDEIVKWSEQLPLWQRDALRRLVKQQSLLPDDIAELTTLCLAPRLAIAEQVPDPSGSPPATAEPVAQPLTLVDVPSGATLGAAVALTAVRHLADVNALKPGESLTFGPSGITLVFGTNGSGKSGYTRILKRACRARGAATPVLANAGENSTATGPPRAEIEALVGDVMMASQWEDEKPCDIRLAAVSVFDSVSTEAYVSQKNDVAFRPFGLDVFDGLGDVMKAVKLQLDARRAPLDSAALSLPPGASVLVGGMKSGTNLGALEAQKLSPSERERLQAARDELAARRRSDPAQRARELRFRSKHALNASGELEALRTKLDAAVVTLTEEVASVAASHAAPGQSMPSLRATLPPSFRQGAGSPLWAALWRAAAAFAEGDIHVGHRFPNLDAAGCVLCQQSFDSSARARMEMLAELYRTAERDDESGLVVRLTEQRQRLGSAEASGLLRSALEELNEVDPVAGGQANAFLAAAAACAAVLTQQIDRLIVSETGGRARLASEVATVLRHQPALPGASGLRELAMRLSGEAEQLLAAAPNSLALQAEVDALEARLWIEENLVQLRNEVLRLRRLDAYDECLKETRTTGLSAKSSELTKKYVTDALAKSFEAELHKLGFHRHSLELGPAGAQAGAATHQVRLRKNGAQKKGKTTTTLSTIVSEGEARCIALAAFLAELGTASHKSGIIFDDPVSSLDHEYRSRVAARLVDEAHVRQVVVFTHDLAFLFELVQLIEEQAGLPFEARTLERDVDYAGIVGAELPWRGKPTGKKIGSLRKLHQELAILERKPGTNAERERLTTEAYAKMRQTWERAVEEVLFNGSVERFRNSVQTKRIRPVSLLEISTLNSGMTKCSRLEGGHDHPTSDPVVRPDAAELSEDIEMLATWVEGIRKKNGT
ncbi:MAG: AAA family ATPase [Deltaproteobacteria bacterium]|nr:AAA family ATPase [Deltaproteobacteria bacterium]